MTQQRMCFKDKGRPCNSQCTAYNKKDLGGTHCIELAAEWSKAKGLHLFSGALSTLNTTISVIVKAATTR